MSGTLVGDGTLAQTGGPPESRTEEYAGNPLRFETPDHLTPLRPDSVPDEQARLINRVVSRFNLSGLTASAGI